MYELYTRWARKILDKMGRMTHMYAYYLFADFEQNGVEETLALQAFKPCNAHIKLGTVHDNRDLGLGGD